MSTLDDLGAIRFEQYRQWRSSGRIESVAEGIDEMEPGGFVVERSGDRWLLT